MNEGGWETGHRLNVCEWVAETTQPHQSQNALRLRNLTSKNNKLLRVILWIKCSFISDLGHVAWRKNHQEEFDEEPEGAPERIPTVDERRERPSLVVDPVSAVCGVSGHATSTRHSVDVRLIVETRVDLTSWPILQQNWIVRRFLFYREWTTFRRTDVFKRYVPRFKTLSIVSSSITLARFSVPTDIRFSETAIPIKWFELFWIKCQRCDCSTRVSQTKIKVSKGCD